MASNFAVFVVFVLCYRMTSCETVKNITIVSPGFFGFSAFPSLSYVGPAIETGVQRLRQILPQYNWTSEYVNDETMTSCNAVLDNIQDALSRWYYTERNPNSLSLIITPGCFEGFYLNQLVSEWDILLITSAAAEDIIADRKSSPTWLTTAGYPPTNLAYCSLLPLFNWTKVYVGQDLDDPTEFYGYTAGLVMGQLLSCGVQFTQSTFSSSDKLTSISIILEDFKSKNRVFLYFGQPHGLRKVLIDATKLNMTSGEYVYIAPIPWTSKAFGNFTWQMLDDDDQVVREAYKSVLLMTLMDEAAFTSPGMRNLTSKWEVISQKMFNNTNLQFELPIPDMVALQAAIEISGMVTHEVFQHFGTSTNPSGTLIANLLMNRTFELQVGRTHMTTFGHTSYQILTSFFDGEKGLFEIFLRSEQLTQNDQLIWNTVTDGRWFGGNVFPPDEPRCGFDGMRKVCRPATYESKTYWAVGASLVGISILWTTSFIFCAWLLLRLVQHSLLVNYHKGYNSIEWCHYKLAHKESWWQLEAFSIAPVAHTPSTTTKYQHRTS